MTIGGKSSCDRFWNSSHGEILPQMSSFCCYDNSDVIATLITTNFHLYLIQLWWQFFEMFVYGDVVYAQTWQVLTLKNCMEAFSYDSNSLSCCIGPRFCSTVLYKFVQLAKLFWVNGLPPPLAKNSPYAYVGSSRSVELH